MDKQAQLAKFEKAIRRRERRLLDMIGEKRDWLASRRELRIAAKTLAQSAIDRARRIVETDKRGPLCPACGSSAVSSTCGDSEFEDWICEDCGIYFGVEAGALEGLVEQWAAGEDQAEPAPQPGPGEVVLTLVPSGQKRCFSAEHIGLVLIVDKGRVRVEEGEYCYEVSESPGEIQARVDAALDALAEDEPTVTLHSRIGRGATVEFVSITRISHREGCGGPFVEGQGIDGYIYGPNDSYAVSESAAEVTRLAREAWGADWSCEGAVPQVEQATVRLTEWRSESSLHFSKITEILEQGSGAWVTGIFGGGKRQMRVAESPAEITAKAREAWPGWTCKGADPQVPEEEPKTVTLHHPGSPYDFFSITNIRPGEGEGAKGFTWVTGKNRPLDNWRGCNDSTVAVKESIAKVSELARKTWTNGWTCEGAVPEVEQATVRLTEWRSESSLHFSKITEILEQGSGAWVTGIFGGGKRQMRVAESPAEITAKAREAWPGWTCKGADPQVPEEEPKTVTLHAGWSTTEFHFTRVTSLEHAMGRDGSFVRGLDGKGRYYELWASELVSTVRALCADNRVPCVGEEEPQVFVGVDPAAEGGDETATLTLEQGADGDWYVTDPMIAKVRSLRERIADLERERDELRKKRGRYESYWKTAQAGRTQWEMRCQTVEAERDALQAQLAERDTPQQPPQPGEIVLHYCDGGEVSLRADSLGAVGPYAPYRHDPHEHATLVWVPAYLIDRCWIYVRESVPEIDRLIADAKSGAAREG